MRHLTPTDLITIRKLKDAGLSLQEIADVIGCSTRTIRRSLYGKYAHARMRQKLEASARAEAMGFSDEGGNYRTIGGKQVPIIEQHDDPNDPLNYVLALERLEQESGDE